jgi:transcription factor MYB, plant
MNHLQPSVDKAAWRRDEDAVVLEAQRELGNRWSAIAGRLAGRTDNSVKNRFKSLQRRRVRERRPAAAR